MVLKCLFSDMASLNLNEGSSGGGSDQDGLPPLPPPGTNPWPLGGQPYPYPGYPTPPPGFPPGYSDPCHSFHSGSAGSQQSEGVCEREREIDHGYKGKPLAAVNPVSFD